MNRAIKSIVRPFTALVRDGGESSAAASAAAEALVGSVVEAEAVLLLRRVEQICKGDKNTNNIWKNFHCN